MFYSQAGQDLWALQLTNKGFFVDIGAYDGIESSNTYALSQAGWGGVCIEPNPEAFAKLKQNRGCICVNKAVTNDFTEILDSILAPQIIDYISLDVDGTELDILKGMDFTKYHVRRITVEHNQYAEGPVRQQAIYDYLTGQGFVRTHKDVRCMDGQWWGKVYEDWYENKEWSYERKTGLQISIYTK